MLQNQMRNLGMEILTYAIKQNSKRGDQGIDMFRDEIVLATLRGYSPEVAP